MRQRAKLGISILTAVVATVVMVVGASGTQAARSAQQTYVIGAVAGLTGNESQFGVPWSEGVKLAASQLKSSGVRVVVADTQSSATQSVNAAKKLVEVDKAKVLVVGSYGGFFAIQSYAASKGVLVINASASSPTIRKLKGSVVSVLALDDTVGGGLADWAYQRGYRSAAFIVGNDPYSTGVKDFVGAAFKKKGGQIVETAIVQSGQPDYRPEMTKVANADPDVIFSTTFSNDAKLQFKQGIELGLDAPWFQLYPTVSGLDDYATAYGKLFGLEVGWLSNAAKAWRAAYKKQFKKDATVPWPALAYDATMLGARGLTSGAAKAPAVEAAILKAAKTYSGPSGKFSFDKDQTRVNAVFQKLALVAPGKYVPAR